MKKVYTERSRSGFTIIELMVVVTIIAILASIAIVALERGRLQARDAKRKADLSLISGAMETYRADNKVYPKPTTGTSAFYDVTAACPAGISQYLSPIPVDPVNDTTYRYKIRSDGNQFKAVAQSEGLADASGDCATPSIKQKAGDFCDSTDLKYFQISSDATARAWLIGE